MFSNLRLNRVIGNYENIVKESKEKNYDQMSTAERAKYNAKIQQIMATAEENNKKIHAAQQEDVIDFGSKLDKILEVTERFNSGEQVNPIEEKKGRVEEKKSHVKEKKDTNNSSSNFIRNKIEKILQHKEEEQVGKLEELLLKSTQDERKLLSKEIQKHFGQSTWSKVAVKVGKAGLSLGETVGLVEKNETRQAFIEAAEELNDARNKTVKEVTNFVENPLVSIDKYWKQWTNIGSDG